MDKYIELLVTIGSLAVLMWGMLKFMLRDIHKEMADMKKDTHDIKAVLSKVSDMLQDVNNRVMRLEGRFEERGYWEAREYRKTGTEEKK